MKKNHKKTNMLFRIASVVTLLIGTAAMNVVMADDSGIMVCDVSNTDCAHKTRGESVMGRAILKLTRNESGLYGEFINYGANCAYGEINVICQENEQGLTINIDEGTGGMLADCTCPINIYFTINNALKNEYQLTVNGISVGTVDFREHSVVEIDMVTLEQAHEEGFDYPVKVQGFWPYEMTDYVTPGKDLSQSLIINRYGEGWLSCNYKYYTLPCEYSYLDVQAGLDQTGTLVINVLTDGIPDKDCKRVANLNFDIMNARKGTYHLQLNHTVFAGSENESTSCLYEGDVELGNHEVIIPINDHNGQTEQTAGTVIIDGIYYNLDSTKNTAEVTYLYYNTSTDKAGSEAHNNGVAYSGDVKIPGKVTYDGETYQVVSIGESAFWNCSGITSIEIPNSVTSIGKQAVYYCSGLTSIDIPNSVISLGERAFQGCSGLTSLVIPNGIKTISPRAFCACKSLTSIEIPNSVTSIDDRAFWECYALTDVYCYAKKVPTTKSNAFASVNLENVTLHVPAASVSAYQAVEPWKNFKEIVALEEQMAYRPFVEDGKVWTVGTFSGNPGLVVDYYYFDGDTIIGGKNCKLMMRQRYVSPDYSDVFWTPTPSLNKEGAWYEENKKVYFYDEWIHAMALKYDFSLAANDTLKYFTAWSSPFIIGPKQAGGIEGFKGVYRDIRMCGDEGQSYHDTFWLEGVGCLRGPISDPCSPIFGDPKPELLLSCSVGDEVIYLNAKLRT